MIKIESRKKPKIILASERFKIKDKLESWKKQKEIDEFIEDEKLYEENELRK